MEDVRSELNQRLDSLEARVADSVLQHAPPVLVARRKEASFIHDKPKTNGGILLYKEGEKKNLLWLNGQNLQDLT